MTIITAKVFGAVGLTAVGVVGEGVMAVMAVLDPSIPNIISVFIGAVVTITMGIIAYKTVLLNKRMDEIKKVAEAQTDKIDLTLRKTDVIEGHVNSEKTAAAGKIAMLEREISLLREAAADKTTTAALLAQAAATTAISPVRAPAKAAEPATLKQIEINTAETAESAAKTAENTAKTEANTARTEANVQDLKDKP